MSSDSELSDDLEEEGLQEDDLAEEEVEGEAAPSSSSRQLAVRRRIEEAMEAKRFREEYGQDLD